ncbi:MAG: response regulator [Deltaproteobacteria bacterium]|jgi:two-component system alkaline phosphatase synthesis response regulator PhoP|nr:response regulator [Deltaproteobacteria bacterium]
MEGRRKVLVIDDEPDLVEMIRMALERQFEVVTAYNGKEGVEKARSDKPDAIVLDIMMPEKDGFAACQELKGDAQTASIPILILTGVGEFFGRTKYTKASGMEIEAEDFITKPVDPNELVRRVNALLKRD